MAWRSLWMGIMQLINKTEQIRNGMTFDGAVGSFGSLPRRPATYDILIMCKGDPEGFIDRCRSKLNKGETIISDGVLKNGAGVLEYRAKVQKDKEGHPILNIISRKAETENSCMIG